MMRVNFWQIIIKKGFILTDLLYLELIFEKINDEMISMKLHDNLSLRPIQIILQINNLITNFD